MDFKVRVSSAALRVAVTKAGSSSGLVKLVAGWIEDYAAGRPPGIDAVTAHKIEQILRGDQQTRGAPWGTLAMHTVSARWDDAGRCFESTNNQPEQRRPDLDFGTPGGDSLIDPWMQDLIKGGSCGS